MSETFRPVSDNLDINNSYSDVILLREGAMSRLYRVSKAGKYLVIKTTKDNSAMQLAMLKREYELSIKLDHYHLPHFYTYDTNTPVGPGFVMEYIDGRNLTQFLSENPTIDTRRRVFRQLLDVVAYIHKNGIIHNDLKPENILISRTNDDVKLLDFGFCSSDAHYLTKNLGGTREFASPELIAQSDHIDARSDIYSLGRLMELIFPYNYRSYSKKCLRKNPEERWENVDQLIRAWRRSSHPIYLILIAVLIGVVTIAALFMRDSGIDAPQQQALLDSLSIAKGQMVKAQQDAQTAQQEAQTAQQEANNAKTEAADARNEARLAQQQFDSIRNIQALSEAERQQWEETKNLAVTKLTQSLEARYRLALDSINKVPFVEFAAVIMANFLADNQKIKEASMASTNDETIKSIISSTTDLFNSENIKTLYNKSKQKSSAYNKSLGLNAIKFYENLITNNLPYRKYDPEKDNPQKDKPTE